MRVSLLGLMLAMTPSILAHHSAVAEYEAKVIMLHGTVTKVEWMNPHVWIFFDVPGAGGTVAKWECEGGAPNGLIGKGWRRNSVKAGDQVTIEASRAKDRPDVCKIRSVTLADGRRLFMGSANP